MQPVDLQLYVRLECLTWCGKNQKEMKRLPLNPKRCVYVKTVVILGK